MQGWVPVQRQGQFMEGLYAGIKEILMKPLMQNKFVAQMILI